jgi:hypothetical protein
MSSESWKAIPTFQPYAGGRLDPVGVDPAEQRAVAAGGRDQRGGLARDDLEVVLERRVDRRDVGRQRAHRALHLADLALAQPRQRARHDAGHLDPEVGRQVRGAGEEVVAGQDRDGVVPARVGRRGAAAGGCLVDHVVVVERREVDELDDDARVDQLGPGRVGPRWPVSATISGRNRLPPALMR